MRLLRDEQKDRQMPGKT